MSVNTEESVVLVDDGGSYQAESFIRVAGAGDPKVSSGLFDVPVEKLERSEEEASKSNRESVWNKTVCVASNLIWWSSGPCGDMSRDGNDLSMHTDIVVVGVAEAEENVDVIGSSTPVHCDVEPEGFTFRELWAMLSSENQAGFLIFLAFARVTFALSHHHSVLVFLV